MVEPRCWSQFTKSVPGCRRHWLENTQDEFGIFCACGHPGVGGMGRQIDQRQTIANHDPNKLWADCCHDEKYNQIKFPGSKPAWRPLQEMDVRHSLCAGPYS